MPCTAVRGELLRWEIRSYSRYFARFATFPRVESSPQIARTLNTTGHVLSAGGFLFLGLFSLAVFSSLPRRFVLSFTSGCLSLSLFLFLSGNAGPWPSLSMLEAHRAADIALLAGLGLLFVCFLDEAWLPRWLFRICTAGLGVGVAILVIARTGDEAQAGTTVGFPFLLVGMIAIASTLVGAIARGGLSRGLAYRLLAVFVFLLTALHDVSLTMGLFDGSTLTPIGFLGAIFALGSAIQHRVSLVFVEHERLRANEGRIHWLERFAGFLRHELKNQLVGIRTSIDLAKRTSESDRHGEPYLSRAHRSTEVMQRLLAAATEATSLEVALSTHDSSPVDLATIARERCADFEPIAATRVLRVSANGTVNVTGDEARLIQLLDKLLANACDHGAAGSAIDVRVRTAGPNAVLEVRNEGDLPPDRARLFEPFHSQARGPSSSENLGLGLYVAKLIAESHGGSISANQSTAGEVVMRVELPLAYARQGEDPA